MKPFAQSAFFLILALLVLGACTQAPPPTVTSIEESTPYPVGGFPEAGGPTPYPGEELQQPVVDAVASIDVKPEYNAETGAFRVQLVYAEDGSPIQGQVFYLAEWLTVPNMPDAGVPALDLANSPHAESNADGVLVISNLAPKRYSLALYTPEGSVLVPNADSQEDVWVEIKPNELMDMGTIRVPIPKSRLEN